jgi:hypothetical protein
MLLNNVLVVVVNVHNLYVIFCDILIQCLVYLENILESMFDIQKKDVDHVLRVIVIHVEYYHDKVEFDERELRDNQFLQKE